MKTLVENPQFQIRFNPDGSALPFIARQLLDPAKLHKVRRQLSPAIPKHLRDDGELNHLRSSFEFYDELSGAHYANWNNRGRPITAEQRWTSDATSIRAEALLRLKGPEKPRGIKVKWKFPLPYLPYSGIGSRYSMWHVWASHLNAPFTNDWGNLVFTHGRCPDIATEIALPAITVYRPDVDLGFTFFLDQEIPWVTRFELDQRQHYLVFEFSHIGVSQEKEASIALRFFCHRGCWRTGLSEIQKRFPKATIPPSSSSRKFEGVMAYTVPGNKKMLRAWRDRMNLKFNEILHFNDFGNYTPKEPWNCRNFWSTHASWRKVDGLTWGKLRDYVRYCKDLGVGAFLYINFADCESRLARKRYPDAIVRNEWGKEMVTWVYPDLRRHCLMMNPDPQFGFSSSILEQAGEIMERLPELDGFHLDQTAYGWIDTAHSDGVTMLNNQPAYNMLLGYRRIGKLFHQLCAENGKLIESNGLIHFQQLEDVDMLMAEGSLSALARYGPICSQRALFFLSTGEKGFQWSLKYGSFPHVSPYEWVPQPGLKIDRKVASLYQAYLPITSLLQGATWVLEPNCLKLPQHEGDENYLGNITGNFFRLTNGDHLVTLLQAPQSVLNTQPTTKEFAVWSAADEAFGRGQDEIRRGFSVALNFKAAESIKTVRLLRPNQSPSNLKWVRKGNRICIAVPELGPFAALQLTSHI